MEHVSPVVSSKGLHNVTILGMCKWPNIIHLHTVWQKKQRKLLKLDIIKQLTGTLQTKLSRYIFTTNLC